MLTSSICSRLGEEGGEELRQQRMAGSPGEARVAGGGGAMGGSGAMGRGGAEREPWEAAEEVVGHPITEQHGPWISPER